MVEPTVTVVAYDVSCLPEDNVNRPHYTLRVAYRGRGRWAVCDGGQCLRKDGHRSYESLPTNRTDRWLAAYRFDLDTALAIARKYAPKMTANRFTVEDALKRPDR